FRGSGRSMIAQKCHNVQKLRRDAGGGRGWSSGGGGTAEAGAPTPEKEARPGTPGGVVWAARPPFFPAYLGLALPALVPGPRRRPPAPRSPPAGPCVAGGGR